MKDTDVPMECPNCREAAYWRTDPYPRTWLITEYDRIWIFGPLRIKPE